MNKQDAINILESSACMRIRFSFRSAIGGTVSVGPETFRRVAAALRSNHIRFTNAEIADNSADARYSPVFNIMQIPERRSENYIIVQSSVVHEAVHASFDLTRSVLPYVDDELAAFLAAHYYSENLNAPQIFRMHPSHQTFSYYIPSIRVTGTLSDMDASELRRVIESRPAYCKSIWERKLRYRMSENDG